MSEWTLNFLMYNSKCTYKWITILEILQIISKLARSLLFLDKSILFSPVAKRAVCNQQKGVYSSDLKLELSLFESVDLHSHVCRESNQQLVVTYCTICAGSLRLKQELKDGWSGLAVIFYKNYFPLGILKGKLVANTLELCCLYGKWQFKQQPMCFTFSRSKCCMALHRFSSQYSALYPHSPPLLQGTVSPSTITLKSSLGALKSA